jgi:hypothetical protein
MRAVSLYAGITMLYFGWLKTGRPSVRDFIVIRDGARACMTPELKISRIQQHMSAPYQNGSIFYYGTGYRASIIGVTALL